MFSEKQGIPNRGKCLPLLGSWDRGLKCIEVWGQPVSRTCGPPGKGLPCPLDRVVRWARPFSAPVPWRCSAVLELSPSPVACQVELCWTMKTLPSAPLCTSGKKAQVDKPVWGSSESRGGANGRTSAYNSGNGVSGNGLEYKSNF